MRLNKPTIRFVLNRLSWEQEYILDLIEAQRYIAKYREEKQEKENGKT